MTQLTMDKLSFDRAMSLHPAVRNDAIALLTKASNLLTGNAQIRFSQTLRTFEEQQALYNQGRTSPGAIVTNARAGYSFHNYGLAFDIVLIIDGKTASWDRSKDYDGDKIPDWQEFVNIAKGDGWKWGGEFKSIKDYPHFEKTFGYSEKTLLDKYNKKDFIPGTKYLNL